MNNVKKFLNETGFDLVRDIGNILMRANRNASHKLYNSLEHKVEEIDGGYNFYIYYAEHGKYVLDSRRRVNKGPSKDAIKNIMNWILQKGIPIGNGRIRTPMKRKGTSNLEPASKVYSKEKERKNFAFAIFNSIKKNKRIKKSSTDFLRPYNNLMKSNDFKLKLSRALTKDGISFLEIDDELKIKIRA